MNASTASERTSLTRGSTTVVAPNFSATSRRAASMSETMTSVAPNALATCVVTIPTGPAPAINTREPAVIPAFWAEAIPTESGSNSAAAS